MIERKTRPLILGIGTFVAASFGATALASLSEEADELFELTALDEGLVGITGSDEGDGDDKEGEGECGEGDCGEGECGEDDDGEEDGDAEDDSGEGECGEGQCGEEE